MKALQAALERCIHELFDTDIEVVVERPAASFGDLTTNVALKLSAARGETPRQVAEHIKEALTKTDLFAAVEIAGPGFINLTVHDASLLEDPQPYRGLAGKTIVTEFSDPNPFKELHAGHLYTSIVGDAVSRLFERAGASVHRLNFGGDVGMHVARALWGVIQSLGGEHPEALDAIPPDDRAGWLARCYVEGTQAFETVPEVKERIVALNKQIYDIQAQQDTASELARLYWTCRQWSYEYFDAFYERIGIAFERYVPESEVAPLGLATVKEQLEKGVFKESEGAVVYDGESKGLHTRVFINREGLPTYETKDVGLALTKWRDYAFDTSFIMTGSEQAEYMKVVLAAIAEFHPVIAERTEHVTHGIVKMVGGKRMSSRKGGNLLAVDVLVSAESAAAALNESAAVVVGLGAVKYAFLKHRIGGDIVFDPQESVSLQGNSGAYLQYAHARARSILEKATAQPVRPQALEGMERTLARELADFEAVIEKATTARHPHLICTYLYELAQVFNSFYEVCRVVGDPREPERRWLVERYADVLRDGLQVLGITAPDRL